MSLKEFDNRRKKVKYSKSLSMNVAGDTNDHTTIGFNLLDHDMNATHNNDSHSNDDEDDESLWKELSTQQSKEIQAHHDNTRRNKGSSITQSTAAAIFDAIQQTTTAVSSAAVAATNTTNVAISTGTAAAKNAIMARRNNQYGTKPTTTSNISTSNLHHVKSPFSDFGLHSSSYSSSMQQKHEQHRIIQNSTSHPLQMDHTSISQNYHHSLNNPNNQTISHNLDQHYEDGNNINHLNENISQIPHNSMNISTTAPLLANEYRPQLHKHDSEFIEAGMNYHPQQKYQHAHQNQMRMFPRHLRNDGEREGGMDFVFLRKFQFLPKSEGWGAVPNLDLFFTSIYNYYFHRGYTVIIGKGIVEIISLFFTLVLSVFLFAYIDWRELTTCQDASSCHADLKDYMISKPFETFSAWNVYVILYCIIFTCYGLFKVFSFLVTTQDAAEAKAFYENKLGISQRKLEGGSVEWEAIVQKVIKLQETGEHRIVIHGQSLDALVVAHRILRKENFLVALLNCQILDLRVPLPWPISSKGYSSQHYLSKSLEWSLHLCIFSYMFSRKFHIRPEFFMAPSALKRRFVICGIAQLVFMPYLLIFMLLHFFFLNVHDWQSSRQYLGPKEWSNIAKWTFREFNELPHAFASRLAPSYENAEDYLKLFTKSSIMICFGQVIVFLSGSILAVLLALATINDSILLHVQLSNWNLLWYVGIFGGIFSAGRSLLPDLESNRVAHRNLFQEMDQALAKVSLSTHYLPDRWRGRGWEKATQAEFSQMFQAKAQLFIQEVVCVIFTPFILMITLPKCAEEICDFIQKVKIEVPGVGHVCGFASFDFNSFEDENWIGKEMNSDHQSQRLANNMNNMRARPKAKLGKMEKSFFSFKTSHPSWKCTVSGQSLVDRVEKFQQEQTLALFARERHHRIEAAKRELETLHLLECLEREKNNSDSNNGIVNINETYLETRSENIVTGTQQHSPVDYPEKVNLSEDYQKENDENEDHLVNSMGAASMATSSTNQFKQHSAMSTNEANDVSVLHYADTALSTELRRYLNKSVLDADGMSATIGMTSGKFNDPLLSLARSSAKPLGGHHRQHLPRISDDDAESYDNTESAIVNHYWLDQYHSKLYDSSSQKEMS